MKKLMTTIGIGLMIALISPSIAQDNKKGEAKTERNKKLTPEEKAQKHTDKMTTELGLSEEQAKEVYEINLSYAKSMLPIHDEIKKLKEQAKNERKKTKSDLDKVLTEEQKAKAIELRKNKKKDDHKGNSEPIKK
jgi:protein CpxP